MPIGCQPSHHKTGDLHTFLFAVLQESASFNKLALRSIVECVIFCGKQGISFRGHRDDATASDPTNRGNFISLLRFRAQSDDVLRRLITHSCDDR